MQHSLHFYAWPQPRVGLTADILHFTSCKKYLINFFQITFRFFHWIIFVWLACCWWEGNCEKKIALIKVVWDASDKWRGGNQGQDMCSLQAAIHPHTKLHLTEQLILHFCGGVGFVQTNSYFSLTVFGKEKYWHFFPRFGKNHSIALHD